MKENIVRATEMVVILATNTAGIILDFPMLLTTLDVAGRYILNSPITGVFDLAHLAVLKMVFWGWLSAVSTTVMYPLS